MLLGVIALVQLLCIHARQKKILTTQKCFVALNFFVMILRGCVFFCRDKLDTLEPVVASFLLDLPGLIFFTTYSLVILFWAEIYEQAKAIVPNTKSLLRFKFNALNALVYITQRIS